LKKYIRLFMLLLCGGLLLLGKAETAQAYTISDEADFVWEEMSDGTIKIIGVTFNHNTVTRVEIPETIYGKPVSAIGGWFLSSINNKVKEIRLPDTVSSLHEAAFNGLERVTKIEVSETTPYFMVRDDVLYSKDGKELYWVSPELTELRILDGVEWINSYTFVSGSQMESIYLPDGVDLKSSGWSEHSLAHNIFADCTKLRRLVVSDTHPYYKTEDGVLYSKDGQALLLVPRAYAEDSFVVPEGVTDIGSYAFWHCTGIREILLPDSVDSLGSYCFAGCTGLVRAEIPDKVSTIPYYAFLGCTSLQEIVLPAGLSLIGGMAFDSCTNLSSIVYGGNVEEIRLVIESGVRWEKRTSEDEAEATDEAMFYWETNNKGNVVITGTKIKKSATEIVIPSQIDGKAVEEIANRAFSGHEKLRFVTIPETVLVIGEEAFLETPALEEIKVATENPNYRTAEGNLYNKDISYLVWVTADETGSFVIPVTVRSMSRLAFSSCKKLTTIHIQGNAKNPEESFNMGTLFNDNFSQCTSLSAIWVDYTNPYYSSVNGVLFTEDGTRLLVVPPAFNVKNYVVPYNVREIGGFSFSGCYKIETVTIPDGIATIELFAFMNCPSIKEITVGHGLTEIGEKAFYYCDALEKVTLPSTVVYMEAMAMEGCRNLKELVLPVADESLKKAFFYGEEWYKEPAAGDTDPSTQPDNPVVPEVSDRPAWDETSPIEPITVEGFVEPQTALLVKQRVRSGTTILFSYQVTIESEVIITGLTQTAQKDKANRKLRIPSQIDGMPVTGIDGGAFAGVPLTEVTLPEGLLEIGMGAFYGCNLTEIRIPTSVCYIGPKAFGANYGMTGIYVQEENETYCSRAGVLYTKDMTMLCQMPANYPHEHFTVPNSVQVIGEYAFGNCRRVTNIYATVDRWEQRNKAFWYTGPIYENHVRVTPEKKSLITEGIHSYSFAQMDYVSSSGVSYDTTEEGYLQLAYHDRNCQLIFALEDVIELGDCAELTLRLNSEGGAVAVVLYDKEMLRISSTTIEKGNGDRVVPLDIDRTGFVEYVGIRAADAAWEDCSDFTSVIYEVTAQMK